MRSMRARAFLVAVNHHQGRDENDDDVLENETVLRLWDGRCSTPRRGSAIGPVFDVLAQDAPICFFSTYRRAFPRGARALPRVREVVNHQPREGTMSKKHFIKLAEALKQTRPERIGLENKWHQWCLMVRAVADVCASTNERFDRGRFLAACGMEDAR